MPVVAAGTHSKCDMALLEKYLKYAKTREAFDVKLESGEIDSNALAVIEDTQELWTHGVFYKFPTLISQLDNDRRYLMYAGEWQLDTSYLKGSIVEFGGGKYIAKRVTSVPPIAIYLLDEDAYALTGTSAYALMGSFADSGNADDWQEVVPARAVIRRTSSSMALSSGHQKVICSNTSAITLTLPTAPNDGCEIWITASGASVTVAAGSGDTVQSQGATVSTHAWNMYVYDAQTKVWHWG